MHEYSRLLLVALLLGACGGETSNGSGTGSTSGSSGGKEGNSGATGGSPDAGASSGGSSNSGVVRGAVSLEILAPEGCSLTAQTLDLPAVASGHPVSESGRSGAIENGAMSADGEIAEVYCLWSGSATPDGIYAGISMGVGSARKVVTLDWSMVDGSPPAGGLNVDTPDLPNNYGTSPEGPCMFTFIEVDEASHSVWGKFSCSVFTEWSLSDACAIGTSFYTFENCSY